MAEGLRIAVTGAAGRMAIALRLPFVAQPDDADAHRGAGTHLDVRDAAEAFALAVRPDRPLVPTAGLFVAIHLAADEVAGDLPTREKIAALNLA